MKFYLYNRHNATLEYSINDYHITDEDITFSSLDLNGFFTIDTERTPFLAEIKEGSHYVRVFTHDEISYPAYIDSADIDDQGLLKINLIGFLGYMAKVHVIPSNLAAGDSFIFNSENNEDKLVFYGSKVNHIIYELFNNFILTLQKQGELHNIYNFNEFYPTSKGSEMRSYRVNFLETKTYKEVLEDILGDVNSSNLYVATSNNHNHNFNVGLHEYKSNQSATHTLGEFFDTSINLNEENRKFFVSTGEDSFKRKTYFRLNTDNAIEPIYSFSVNSEKTAQGEYTIQSAQNLKKQKQDYKGSIRVSIYETDYHLLDKLIIVYEGVSYTMVINEKIITGNIFTYNGQIITSSSVDTSQVSLSKPVNNAINVLGERIDNIDKKVKNTNNRENYSTGWRW